MCIIDDLGGHGSMGSGNMGAWVVGTLSIVYFIKVI